LKIARGSAAFVFLGAFFLAFAARAAECEKLASVKGGLLPDGRVLVPVTVEGRALYFLLDTGGISTTMKWELARDMKLPVKQTTRTLTGMGGSSMNFAIEGENFSIAGLRVENKPIYVEGRPLPFADGTLSSDILRDYDVEIDLAQVRISLAASGRCEPPPGASAVAIDVAQSGAHSGHVRFPIKIDGTTIMATLDTGAATSLISMRAAALLGVYPTSPELRAAGRNGPYQLYTYPFQAMEIGEVTVDKPRIIITGDSIIPGMDSEMVLGIDALAGMHLTIAYGQNRLYISGARPN
jgi:predicted aspartyl protease